MRRLAILSTLALLAVAAGCGSGGEADVTQGEAAGSTFAGAELGEPTPAPEISLLDAKGRRVRLSDQRGKVVLVTFLYTRCPDVCPLIAENLNRALGKLGPSRSSVRVLAVSVDPKGDTPARVRSYAAIHRLRPQFHYLVGSKQQLQPVWRAYDVLAFASDPENEVIEHTAQTLLVDPEGLERAVYPADLTADDVVHDVRALLEG